MLIGNLGRDPEIKHLPSGTKVASLSIATSERWKDRKTEEKKERTEWHKVVVFNEQIADIAEKYLRRGSKIYIEGALQTRKWIDQSGAEKYSTEIILQNFNGKLVMLDSRGGDESMQPKEAATKPEFDDDIPF
jgi:single-strand DNA-binding protein